MMRVNRCPKIASIKMGVTDEEKVEEILWLTAFEEQLASLLSLVKIQQPETEVQLFRSTEEQICEALLSLTNLVIVYDKEKSTIVRIST